VRLMGRLERKSRDGVKTKTGSTNAKEYVWRVRDGEFDSSDQRRNLVAVMSVDMLGRLVPVLVLPVLARRLGAEGFGRLAFVNVTVAFLAMAASWGLYSFSVRELSQAAEGDRSRVIGETLIIRGVLSSVAFVALFLAAPTFQGRQPSRAF